MHKRTRIFWGSALLLSIVWMAGGAFFTSAAFDGGAVGQELEANIQRLAADANVAVPASLPLSLAFFLLTGLPVALLALFGLRRARGGSAAIEAAAAGSNLRRQTILITILALILALLIWNISDIERMLRGGEPGAVGVSILGYPIRLFVTFVHEAGHSLAALISGGQVHGFSVSPDGSGLARISGGSLSLILPAGYLGAALFGSLLFLLANRAPRWTRALSILLGLAIIALTLAFAMPDAGGSPTALIVGIGFGLAMLFMGWQASRVVNLLVLETLAILTGLNALLDLSMLVRNPTVGSESLLNDAAAFSQNITPLLPPAVVAALWAAVAVAMLAAAMYFGFLKPASGEISDTVKSKT